MADDSGFFTDLYSRRDGNGRYRWDVSAHFNGLDDRRVVCRSTANDLYAKSLIWRGQHEQTEFVGRSHATVDAMIRRDEPATSNVCSHAPWLIGGRQQDCSGPKDMAQVSHGCASPCSGRHGYRLIAAGVELIDGGNHFYNGYTGPKASRVNRAGSAGGFNS